jgi:hypothetical protein
MCTKPKRPCRYDIAWEYVCMRLFSCVCVCVWLGGCARQALDKGYFLNDGRTVECTSCTTLLITCARAPRNSPVP